MDADSDHNSRQPSSREADYTWSRWSAPWHGVSAKLGRAHELFWDVNDLVWQYLRTNEISLETALAPDLGEHWLRVTVHAPQESTTQISLVFGDFLNNLRAALDHTLGVLDPVGGKRANFPICETLAEFENWAHDWTEKKRGRADLVEPLRERQPYATAAKSGAEPRHERLRIISYLNNTDKHRMLLVTAMGHSSPDRVRLKYESEPVAAEVKWVLPQRPLDMPSVDALHVRFASAPSRFEIVDGSSIPLGISIERYADSVGLGWGLLEQTVGTCSALRGTYEAERLANGPER